MDGFVSMEEKVAVSAVTDQSAVADQSTSTCKGTINQEPVHLMFASSCLVDAKILLHVSVICFVVTMYLR